MQFTHPVQKYVRSTQPPTKENLPSYLEEELKKIEKVLASIYGALQNIATHVP